MKPRMIFALIALTILSSCKKSYKYTEMFIKDKPLGGTELVEENPVVIEAKNDTLAYLDAYQKFFISKKAHAETEKKFGPPPIKKLLIDFKLYNEQGTIISDSISFATKKECENSIRKVAGYE